MTTASEPQATAQAPSQIDLGSARVNFVDIVTVTEAALHYAEHMRNEHPGFNREELERIDLAIIGLQIALLQAHEQLRQIVAELEGQS